MIRSLVLGDGAHFPKVSLGVLGAHRIEMRVRGLLVGTTESLSVFRGDGFSFTINGDLRQFQWGTFKSGETAGMAIGFSHPMDSLVPRRREFKLRLQFDPAALSYSLELWDLLNGDHLGAQCVNGVGGAVVTAAGLNYDNLGIGNSSFGSQPLSRWLDYFRVFNTVVPYNSAAPSDAAPSPSALHFGLEMEDNLTDSTGAHTVTWQGGGSPTFIDGEVAPATAPTLSSATYSTGPDVVTLAFTDPNSGGREESWVDVERREGTTGDWLRMGFTVTADATSYVDSMIQHGKVYNYRTKARNRIGSTAYSNIVSVTTGAGTDTNPTVTENLKTGTSSWPITVPATNREIEGYADQVSANRGTTINLKVNSAGAANFDIHIFRMGWYGGTGARLVKTVSGVTGVAQTMPTETSPSTGRYDYECNWSTSHALSLTSGDPTEWPSGVYIARLTQAGTGKQANIIFTVRDDTRRSEFYFNSPVNTWNAYNHWPNVLQDGAIGTPPNEFPGQGRSSYVNFSGAVSFNRPYMVPAASNANFGLGAGSFFAHELNKPTRVNQLADEYNYLRWMEKQGYDIQYGTDVDLHVMQEKIWGRCTTLALMSHGEYVSWEQFYTTLDARDYGRHLLFLGANMYYWVARLEAGPVTGQANRTMIAFKDIIPSDPYNLSPDPLVPEQRLYDTTRKWQYFPLTEQRLLGNLTTGDFGDDPLTVTSAGAAHWLFAGTSMTAGSTATGLVGYEFSAVNGSADVPPGGTRTVLTHTAVVAGGVHEATHYQAPNGAHVVSVGTMQLGWALDTFGSPAHRTDRSNAGITTMMSNLMTATRVPTIAEAGTGGGGGGGSTGRRPLRRFGLRTRRV